MGYIELSKKLSPEELKKRMFRDLTNKNKRNQNIQMLDEDLKILEKTIKACETEIKKRKSEIHAINAKLNFCKHQKGDKHS